METLLPLTIFVLKQTMVIALGSAAKVILVKIFFWPVYRTAVSIKNGMDQELSLAPFSQELTMLTTRPPTGPLRTT